MKISNSKKQLAKIIHENGGWRDGAESAAQCVGGEISFWQDTATRQSREGWCGNYLGRKHDIEFTGVKLHNWHQTILSRDEYFHLHPVAETAPEPEIQSEIMGIAQVDDINVVESKPTIEQLAADYRNRKDYAERKQQEADAAKADADETLRKLELAGEEIGLIVTPIAVKKESELVSEVKVGDEVECTEYDTDHRFGVVCRIDESSEEQPIMVNHGNGKGISWPSSWKFIRRP